MKELQTRIADSYNSIESDGILQKVIDDKVTQTVKSAVDEIVRDVFGCGSDFRKNLESAVNNALKVDFSTLGIAEYNHTVLNIVQEQLNNITDEKIRSNINERLTMILDTPPEKITLTELVQEFKKRMLNRYNNDGQEEITFIFDNSPSPLTFKYIYLDSKSGTSQYNCQYRLIIKKIDNSNLFEVWSAEIGEREVDNGIFIGKLHSFDRLLFQLHTGNTKLELDINDSDDVNCKYNNEKEDY